MYCTNQPTVVNRFQMLVNELLTGFFDAGIDYF